MASRTSGSGQFLPTPAQVGGGGFDLSKLLGGGGFDPVSLGLGGLGLIMDLFGGGEPDPFDDVVDTNDPRARFINPKDTAYNASRGGYTQALGLARRSEAPTTIHAPKGVRNLEDFTLPGLDNSAGRNYPGLADFIQDLINPAAKKGPNAYIGSRTGTPVGMRTPNGQIQGTGSNPSILMGDGSDPRAVPRGSATGAAGSTPMPSEEASFFGKPRRR